MKTNQPRRPSTGLRPVQFSTTDLTELGQQLKAWRGSSARRSRIPDQVWKAAAALAGTHGVSKVAGALRLDYYKVRQHVSGSASAVSAAGFVEIPWPDSSSSMPHTCTVELCSARGGRMTLRFPGDSSALVALAQAFWKAQR